MLKNYHILIIKHVGATDTNAAQVKIISERFKCSIKIGYSNDPGVVSPAIDTATMWLEENGFILIGKGEGKDHYYIITDTFKPLK